MLQKSGRLVLWEAMFILELHSAETQERKYMFLFFVSWIFLMIPAFCHSFRGKYTGFHISLTTSLHLALQSNGTIVIINLQNN